MRIEQLEYWDKDTGWKLARTDFGRDLTLLVGASGVGKTKILDAIRTLRRIVRPEVARSRAWGVEWRTQFLISRRRYFWEGEYEGRPTDDAEPRFGAIENMLELDDKRSPGPKLHRERLSAEGDHEPIIDRDKDTIRLNGTKTPRLSPHKSALDLLREEESVKPVADGFAHIAYLDQTTPPKGTIILNFDAFCKRYNDLRKLQEADLPLYVKMAILYEVDKQAFGKIVAQFRGVFPIVEDVRFVLIGMEPFAKIPDLRIKETGVDRWIPENQVSSGMFRTLMHLGSVALWPDESVILIDEFENSLGVNCLDDVTGDMMGHRHHLQFVVTSHHPYIINNIPPSHWKLVTRKASEVRTVDAAEAGIGKSRHEAFIQLLNNPLYQEGVASK